MYEDDEIQNNLAVRIAARKFKRRRDRERPSENLLQILKQSREAAGLPLNPIADTFRSSSLDDRVPSAINESPQQEAILDPSENSQLGYVQDKPYLVQDYVYVEPEWNDQISDKQSWHDNKSLIESNLYMLTNEIGCDVTLVVGEAEEEIYAHSYVLSSRSATLADILADQNNLDVKTVIIPDVNPDTFRVLLRYVYTDEIELSVELATNLIPASSAYGPASLKTSCFYFLLSEMNADNVCVTLEHAHTFKEKDAYDRCMNFIYVNATDVLKSPNFEKLCRDCVEDVVKSDNLNAKEFVVFEALTSWASRKCTRKRLQPTDVNKRKVLDKILFHVRFATMDVSEFTQKISERDILRLEERISLFQFFNGETDMLPPQFNKGNRHEYVVNKDLVAKTFGKGETNEYLPDIPTNTVFPAIAYKQTEEYEPYLPIKKVVRFQGVDKNWQTKGADAIGFCVSKPITLRGVQIFGPSFSQDSFHADIVVYDDHGDIVRHEVKTLITGTSLKVYDLILSSSVRVPLGRTFTIQVTSRGKPAYHGINGLEVVKVDDYRFQFFNSNKSVNQTDTTIGQIPTILFDKL